MRQLTESYLGNVIEGKIDALSASFAREPWIDDPMVGKVQGREAFAAFVPRAAKWLKGREARLEHLRTTHIDARTVVEWVVHLKHEGTDVPLPVAVVGEHPSGEKLNQVRVYHSMWPLTEKHQVRAALLPARHDLAVLDVVATYQRALAEGDVKTIVGTFEPDGYFREPAGGEWVYQGTAKLHEHMTAILASGGIGLEHCTVTDDGVACAIEFNAVKFGTHPLVPQAGVAVYERGATGRLHAARIYDDVNVEAFAGKSQ